MLSTRRRIARLATTLFATALFAFGTFGHAYAADDGSVVVQGGSLSITDPDVGAFALIQMDGDAIKTSTASLAAFSVTDARGSGAGWHVTVQATQFTEWDGNAYVASSPKTLHSGSLSLSQPTVTADADTGSAVPTVNAGPYVIDGGSAMTIASAALDQGMGRYDFGATTFTLSVKPDRYAKTYRSDVTISVVTAP